MSETHSLNLPDQTTGPTRSADTEATKPPDLTGHALFERLGVGGMGEVYGCGDDALGRDLAIKILRADLHGDAVAEGRFLREARLTGSLQHPGVVPVHHLGRLADGRPYYTMKLIRGRTLGDLLREEPDGPERLPCLLGVVEKVCQAVAFAHCKGVIHRDLKPSNVMVGEFGEVQVMDWGLAKELSHTEVALPPTEATEATEEVETVGRVEEAAGLSRAGTALGTPGYMPPEQAAGDWDIVDERADVFALGAVLCQVLTGRPPYHGADRDDLLRRARRGDLTETLGRLERCGADAALVNLCRECLSAEREGRPRHAGVVAERLAAYQAEVRERLRQAELERARAEVQTREERKRRRLRAALALAALLLAAGGALVWWQGQRRQDEAERSVALRQAEADGAAAEVMAEARLLGQQARTDPLGALGYDKAVLAAAKAGDVARAGGASEAVQRQAETLRGELQREAEAAAKDRRLLARLLEARGPREGPKYGPDDEGTMMALAEPTVEDQFASAFREWGLDVDAVSAAEAAARLKTRPAAVVTEVIAALGEWASQRRMDRKKGAEWRQVAALAAALDDDPGSLRSEALDEDPGSVRRELRAIVARDQLPVERSLGMLSAALRPVPVPVAVPLGQDRARLRQLAERIDPAVEPVLGLLTLTRALRVAGEEALAERLLRRALTARPREVVLYHTLGQLLTAQEPPRWSAAAECYRAARALRPDLGVSLAMALLRSGQVREGLDLLAWLVKEQPKNPYLHFLRGEALRARGDLDGAILCLKKSLALDPKDAKAHINLGVALFETQDLDGAIAYYRKALELNPKDSFAHNNLGNALHTKGDLDGAVSCYRKALDLNPWLAQAHYNLGGTLKDKHDLDGAIACFQKALELNPRYVKAHNNLGNALHTKGDLDGAITCFQKALDLNPSHIPAYINLGLALHDKHDLDRAIATYRKALELDPKVSQTYNNLGNALKDKHDLDGAIACFQKALDLNPRYVKAHNNLGVALRAKGDLIGAIAAYQKALALDPKYAKAHNNLGNALHAKGDLDGAVAAYRKAVEFDPTYAKAWDSLVLTLLRQGRYAEARDATRRAMAVLPSGHPQQRLAAQQLQSCEQYLALDGKLPAILRGEASPASPGEALTLAQMCQQHKKRHVAAARLYADAFTAEPKLAADLRQQHGYNAACSAALAAAGEGEDARLLPDKAVCMFRHWALGWLRADLTAYTKLAERNNPPTNKVIQQRLVHWRRDTDLVSVRDHPALDRLAEAERIVWRALWRDVDELAKRVAKKDQPTKGRQEPATPKDKPEGRSLPPSRATGR
jgi:tetratricopeptide (TPR) repeat protein